MSPPGPIGCSIMAFFLSLTKPVKVCKRARLGAIYCNRTSCQGNALANQCSHVYSITVQCLGHTSKFDEASFPAYGGSHLVPAIFIPLQAAGCVHCYESHGV